jgi:predicted DNA-binding protein (UPF0251 family)
MARPKSLRKVVKPPGFKGYKPYGAKESKGEAVEMLYEEYEALKLADYDLMNHQEASELMGVSRATFARIYERARRKIALAMVEVKEIKSVYGHAWLDKSWFVCNQCHARFTIPSTISNKNCPVCSSSNIESLAKDE